MTYKFDLYYQTSSFIWLNVCIKKESLMDLMPITQKKSPLITEKTSFVV